MQSDTIHNEYEEQKDLGIFNYDSKINKNKFKMVSKVLSHTLLDFIIIENHELVNTTDCHGKIIRLRHWTIFQQVINYNQSPGGTRIQEITN